MENQLQDPLDHMRYERARKRVKQVSGFYKHLATYILVNLFILSETYFDLKPNEAFLTFDNFSVAFFWGFGLLVHALSTFGPNAFMGQNWEERKINEIMEREKGKKWE
ncbi:MAG: 2TM domain-containing protein [Flavobacterium sp.]|uniref:2TM domain-containing protein n=1 Tax=Flavobacterium sp. TaxID=239 RepID=UPI00122B9DD0|nr:2TM domain-containing protein [Flavobacterium sp.]RZJ65792.1 MAG: 2TM domain-containing protein [Flavobacterium sp.]